jgi:predicted CXXCH cytochrome family protein
MKVWTVVACASVLAVLSTGCNPTTRYKALSLFFDGVPPPMAGSAGTTQAAAANVEESRQVGYREHGPYAAHLCNACHDPNAFNSLVLPQDQICFQCHDLKLDKEYIHGPLASGGCLACHDPHSSQYRYLLVSESDSFCFYCHDRQIVARIGAHAGIQGQCTSCHNPHMSDKKYLLR